MTSTNLTANYIKFITAYILAQGGRIHGNNLLSVVKALQISWYLAMLAEIWYFHRPFIPLLATSAIAATIIGQILRYLSMRSLAWRWILPTITIPNTTVVDTGIYRYLRHPNWLGVMLEIAAVPLIHGAYITAIAFTVANAFLMSKRIKFEENALRQDTNSAHNLC